MKRSKAPQSELRGGSRGINKFSRLSNYTFIGLQVAVFTRRHRRIASALPVACRPGHGDAVRQSIGHSDPIARVESGRSHYPPGRGEAPRATLPAHREPL